MTTLCISLNDVDEQCSEQQLFDAEIQRVDLGVWDFSEYGLNNVIFTDTPLTGVSFRKCWASGVVFRANAADDRGMGMRGVNFATSVLFQSRFVRCALQEAVFLGATLERILFDSSQLPASNFSGAQILNCEFRASNLGSADFERATLIRSTFLGAGSDENISLERANFKSAVLIDVDFARANLFATDFTGAVLIRVNFTGANLTHCKFDDCTQIDSQFKNADIDKEQLNSLIQSKGPDEAVLHEQDQIQSALEDRSKEELIELVSHLTKAYVIDTGTVSQAHDIRIDSPASQEQLPIPAVASADAAAEPAPAPSSSVSIPATPVPTAGSQPEGATQPAPAADPTPRRKRSRMVEFD